jgi:hypothetical protein
MKNLIPILLVLVLPGIAVGQGGSSKTGTAAATFLEIPVGARAVGFGSAFVSLSNDVTALYWNPAGIARSTLNEATLAHTNWIAGTKFDFAGLVIPMGDFGTMGFSFTQLGMEDMKVRTVELPEGTGEYFSARDMAIGVSYARLLSDRFAVGFTGKFIQETIWHESASALALDVGTIFRTDLIGGLTIGASLSNFGSSMTLSGRDARSYIRVDPSKLGSNDQIPVQIEFDSWDLPLLFQLGLSTTALKTDDFRWTVAGDAMYPSDYFESFCLGTEVAFRNYFFLRAGFTSIGPPDSDRGGLSLGIGLTSDVIATEGIHVSFDYAYRDMGRLEGVHVISFSIGF